MNDEIKTNFWVHRKTFQLIISTKFHFERDTIWVPKEKLTSNILFLFYALEFEYIWCEYDIWICSSWRIHQTKRKFKECSFEKHDNTILLHFRHVFLLINFTFSLTAIHLERFMGSIVIRLESGIVVFINTNSDYLHTLKRAHSILKTPFLRIQYQR